MELLETFFIGLEIFWREDHSMLRLEVSAQQQGKSLAEFLKEAS